MPYPALQLTRLKRIRRRARLPDTGILVLLCGLIIPIGHYGNSGWDPGACIEALSLGATGRVILWFL